MTFPKSKSRTLTLDGRTYYWTLSSLGDFAMQLRVSAGGSQLSHVIEAYSLSAVAVKPRFVAAMIRHGLAAGWQPELSGPEFRLRLPARPGTYVSHAGATRVESATHTFDIPATGDLLCSHIDVEPIREQWPWEHHRNLFVDARAWKGVNEKTIGSFMAQLAAQCELEPDQDADLILRQLARKDPEEWALSGGVQFWRDGKLLMSHGCCVGLGSWWEWNPDHLDTGFPWNGHDPFSSARREADRIHLYEEPQTNLISLDLDSYGRLLDGLGKDLRDFRQAVRAWLQLRTDRATARRIVAKLTSALALTDEAD